ncbi:hypothetical protein ISG33_11170 [Glaciecola sp. MH2013]|uniref:DUF4304 domain-containing protein n=1 Tax=Glaciecola sp. MH2013 TaxID=2785524 RepID=UPI0018A08973|nr:DUF4304 domain-containing protein [Glaciecola sp. MH2013]MBF7073960.1 hypothetical protein [Glaciecola sp. MH2013]
MTTIAQLVKHSKKSLIPSLEEHGFSHCGKLCFVRETEGGVYHILFANLSYGENFGFQVTCFVEEHNPKKMKNFPFEVNIFCGGNLGEGLIAGELWEVDTLDNIEEVFDDVLCNIKSYALPWFETVQTREDYVREIYPHIKEKLEAEGRLDAVLHGTITNTKE